MHNHKSHLHDLAALQSSQISVNNDCLLIGSRPSSAQKALIFIAVMDEPGMGLHDGQSVILQSLQEPSSNHGHPRQS